MINSQAIVTSGLNCKGSKELTEWDHNELDMKSFIS